MKDLVTLHFAATDGVIIINASCENLGTFVAGDAACVKNGRLAHMVYFYDSVSLKPLTEQKLD